jgi:hypothetical protein
MRGTPQANPVRSARRSRLHHYGNATIAKTRVDDSTAGTLAERGLGQALPQIALIWSNIWTGDSAQSGK